MFGIIFGVIVGIGAVASGAKLASENREFRNKAIERDKENIKNGKVADGTYWKMKNGRYGDYTYDGKQVSHRKADNGDHILTDPYGDKIYRNYTEEQKELNFERNKRNADDNCIAVSTGLYGKTYYGTNNIGMKEYVERGVEYRNIKTGEKYYIVRLPLTDPKCEICGGKTYRKYDSSEWVEFYIDEKGKLVCITDDERIENPEFENRQDIKEFIRYFNSLQRGKDGGWNRFIRDKVPGYISNRAYAIDYYCLNSDYHSVKELKKNNNRDSLIV